MSDKNTGLAGILKTLGPGILFAGAAIGGSHLVQSTRAGACYGFSLVWVVLLALVCKYPFFEYAHRYTAATGESLLMGYRRLGMVALVVFFVVAAVVAVINCAAVTLVSAGLVGNLLGLQISMVKLSVLVLVVVGIILLIGRYPALDMLMKIMVAVLGIATIAALIIAFKHGPCGDPNFVCPDIWSLAGVSFLLALMGWMPAPIDVSVWPSLWSLERKKQTGHTPTVKESLIDFHIGYLSTGVLALAFVGLGSLVMCGTGKEFSNSGISFSGQLVELYSSTLGSWSWGLISLVAFLTMFSTTLTVMDGYARTLKGSVELMFPAREKSMNWLYWLLLPVLMILSLLIIGCFMSGFKTLIDVATILAFLTAPVFAVLNFKVVLAKQMPDEQKPGLFMKTMSWIGILVLCGFSLVYIYLRWF